MTLDQIELVQTSFAKVVPISDTAAACSTGAFSRSRPRSGLCSKATCEDKAES